MRTPEFLDLVKVTASVPSQATYSDEDILSLATDEMRSKMFPLMISVREDFFLTTQDVALIGNQSLYSIPERAIGGKLNEITWTDGADREYNLSRVTSGQQAHLTFNFGSGRPTAFGFQSSKVKVYPTPGSADGSLRMYYYERPSKLVPEANSCRVTSIAGNDITVNTITDSRFVSSALVDIIDDTYGFETIAKDLEITNVVGQVLTISGASSTSIAVGDFISIAKESPVVQLPLECVSLLVTLTAMRLMESQSDRQGLEALMKRGQGQAQDLINMLSPRAENEPKKVVNFHSLLF